MMGLCHGGGALRVSDSTIECWDYNHYGQMGIGTTASRSQPVFVNGMDSARAASLRDDLRMVQDPRCCSSAALVPGNA